MTISQLYDYCQDRDEQVPEFTVYLDSRMIGYVRDEWQLRLISKTLETVAQSVMRDLQ